MVNIPPVNKAEMSGLPAGGPQERYKEILSTLYHGNPPSNLLQQAPVPCPEDARSVITNCVKIIASAANSNQSMAGIPPAFVAQCQKFEAGSSNLITDYLTATFSPGAAGEKAVGQGFAFSAVLTQSDPKGALTTYMLGQPHPSAAMMYALGDYTKEVDPSDTSLLSSSALQFYNGDPHSVLSLVFSDNSQIVPETKKLLIECLKNDNTLLEVANNLKEHLMQEVAGKAPAELIESTASALGILYHSMNPSGPVTAVQKDCEAIYTALSTGGDPTAALAQLEKDLG